MPGKSKSTKVTTLVVAVVFTISVSGYFMGMRQTVRETEHSSEKTQNQLVGATDNTSLKIDFQISAPDGSTDVIDYASELDKIHKKTSTVINTHNNKFPLLSKRLNYCNSDYSVWFTLKGMTSEIGVLVIVYKNQPPTDMVYYSKHILDGVNRLTMLLDYENRNSYK